MNHDSAEKRRSVEEQLIKWLDDEPIDVNLLSGLAGDRELNVDEKKKVRKLLRKKRSTFHSDLLFVLTQKYFAPAQAKIIWNEIIDHKKVLYRSNGRNVGVFVAALDYLSNIRRLIDPPTLFPSQKFASVAEFALRDGLTGLFVHSTVMTKLESELKRWNRYGDTSCIMMLDIDDFKKVNDTYGHQMGDAVLEKTAYEISRTTRETDIVGRYGGEEFLVVLPRTSIDEAIGIGDRIRVNVRNVSVCSIRVTISIGISAFPRHGKTSTVLIRSADQALNLSKRFGKNRVTPYPYIQQAS